ncbi:MAG: hypothetical protein C0597_00830 [Marinilabiliales bacterium]|nr:MAG: hypothetical protein C0597_00830 [Marinilabiliales bacterium]
MAPLRHFFIMSTVNVRVNGRGNAWPVILGQDHPFYNRHNFEDLANASFSIIKSSSKDPKEKDIEWDLMIDAGHGAVQYLLKNCNRIPEAVFLTHPNIDHTLGLDWIVQSYYKVYQTPYPVYATILCWKIVKTTFPHLVGLIEFKEIIPYEKIEIQEIEGVELIPFPAYHGKSAVGATMLFFIVHEDNIKRKILFTGDILCPLLREEDYTIISEVDLLVTDANNRFPYPKSNHWSITGGLYDNMSQYLSAFFDQCTLGLLLEPHLLYNATDNYARCFDYFLNREISIADFYFTLESFIKRISPHKVALIHYSGGEDLKYYNENILTTQELELWANNSIGSSLSSQFIVPYVSQHMDFLTTTKTTN